MSMSALHMQSAAVQLAATNKLLNYLHAQEHAR